MVSTSKELKNIAAGFVIFAGNLIVSLFAFPFIAIAADAILGRMAQNYLFFWPQLILLPYGLIGRGASQIQFGQERSFTIAVVFWILIGLIFGWILKSGSNRLRIALAFPAIILTAVIVSASIYIAGFGPYLENP